jgi:hypothetical protein
MAIDGPVERVQGRGIEEDIEGSNPTGRGRVVFCLDQMG